MCAVLLAWNVFLTVRIHDISKNAVTSDTNQIEYEITNYTSDLSKMISSIRGSVVQVEDGAGCVFSCVDTVIHILTSADVVQDAETVSVTFDSGAVAEGKVLGKDDITGIAVVEIQSGFTASALKHADSDEVMEGEVVVAMGGRNGVTLETESSMGIIQSQSVNTHTVQILKSDTSVQHCKGGPLVNVAGEVVGIITNEQQMYTESIGINDAIAAYDEIVDAGNVTRGMLNIQYRDIDDLKPYQKNEHNLSLDLSSGILVTGVFGNAKDILQVNDVITAINTTAVKDGKDLREIQYDLEPSQECTLNILRDGKELTVSVIAE